MQGFGCSSCSGLKKLENKSFIDKSNEIHDNKYDYSKVEYKQSKQKVCIVCKEHGEFLQTPNSHFNGVGCPKCKKSHGENEISKILKNKNLIFKEQFRIKNCKNKKQLPFDFAVFDKYGGLLFLIEYDGKQHFKDSGSIFYNESILTNDFIKTKYCIDNGIILYRINYKQNIEEELNKILQY